MAVFRIERTRDYTVMSNHHLRNHELSLKAKGLLSMMLSLPDDWNYTTRGLAKICKEGVDAIGNALRELETAGYIVRNQLRDRQGRISDTEYVIYEQPQPKNPDTPQPDTTSPDTENPDMEKPDTEKPAELNIEKPNTQKQNTHRASTDSIPFRETAAVRPPERKGRDAMSASEMESYEFNNQPPADYHNQPMSVSDIIAIKRDGKVSCHYCDSFGFEQLPGFLPDNPLKNAEMAVEDDYGMIDGIINNGPKEPTVAQLEQQARSGQPISLMDLAAAAHREDREKKKSVMEQLKSQPKAEHKKTAQKKSAEREI